MKTVIYVLLRVTANITLSQKIRQADRVICRERHYEMTFKHALWRIFFARRCVVARPWQLGKVTGT